MVVTLNANNQVKIKNMKAKKLLVVLAGAALPFLGNAQVILDSTPWADASPASTSVSFDAVPRPEATIFGIRVDGGIGGLLTLTAPEGTDQTFTVSFEGSLTVTQPNSGLTFTVTGEISPNPTVYTVTGGTTLSTPISFGLYGEEWDLVADLTPLDWTGDPIPVIIESDNSWTISASGNGTGELSALSSGGEVYLLIPEPQTYALLAGLGMLGFVAFRRFRG